MSESERDPLYYFDERPQKCAQEVVARLKASRIGWHGLGTNVELLSDQFISDLSGIYSNNKIDRYDAEQAATIFSKKQVDRAKKDLLDALKKIDGIPDALLLYVIKRVAPNLRNDAIRDLMATGQDAVSCLDLTEHSNSTWTLSGLNAPLIYGSGPKPNIPNVKMLSRLRSLLVCSLGIKINLHSTKIENVRCIFTGNQMDAFSNQGMEMIFALANEWNPEITRENVTSGMRHIQNYHAKIKKEEENNSE